MNKPEVSLVWGRGLVVAAASVAMTLVACSHKHSGVAPKPASVEPSTVITAFQDVQITISGTGFSPVVVKSLTTPEVRMPRVILVAPDGTEYEIPPANVAFPAGDLSGDNLVVLLPAGIAPPYAKGDPDVVYDIKIINPDGKVGILPDALTIAAPNVFTLVGIDPPFAYTGADTTVTITSDGSFVSTPTVQIVAAGTSETPINLERVAFVDGTTITAVVPKGTPVGEYDVIVINPPSNGGTGTLDSGLRVVANPVPKITGILPGSGTTQQDQPIDIYGANFRDPVEVVFIDDANNEVAAINVSVSDPKLIKATAPIVTASMATTQYLVRVKNLDEGTYFTFSSFLVTNWSAKINNFEALPGTLHTGRSMLAGASAVDDLGNHFIYAIAGKSELGPVDSIEVAQLSKFGALSDWREQRYTLSSQRVGAAAVAVPVGASRFEPDKTYIYVIGGLDDTGAPVDSVERALVLPASQAPKISDASASAEAGTLAAGTWYYKVAAMMDTGDADNPDGETLASDEAIVTLASGGSVKLTWSAVSGAKKYVVYRTDVVNGQSGTELEINSVDAPTVTYTDHGDATKTAVPLGPGATGVFVKITGSPLGTARWGHQAVLVTDENGARSILVLGGKGSTDPGILDSVEVAAIDSDGQLGTFGASTSLVTAAAGNPEARAFFSAVVENSETVFAMSPSAGSRVRLLAGLTAGGETNTLQEATFTSSGLSGWTSPNNRSVQAKAGTMGVVTNDMLILLGGATANDTAGGPTLSGFIGDGRIAKLDASGFSSSISSASGTLDGNRAFGVAVVGAGLMYVIGGTSDGSDALDTVEFGY